MNPRWVLFVDDDMELLSSLRRALVEEPYECLFASSGQEALDLMARHTIHVMVADVRMPGMSGLELLGEVRRQYPRIVCVLLSGNPHIESQEASSLVQAVHRGDIFMFAAKSVDLDVTVKQITQAALDHYAVGHETGAAARLC